MSRVRALGWAVFSLIIGALTYWLAVTNSLGQEAENSVLNASEFSTSPPAPLSLVSNITVIGSLIAIAIIALWVHGFWRAVSILFASVLSLVASQILKEAWLERPELVEFVTPNSYPSGHMTVFAVVSAGLIWAFPRSFRVLMMLLTSVLMSVVGWQLLEYGWHRPSDIIGALSLTLCAFALTSAIGPRTSKSGESRSYSDLNRMFAILFTMIAIVVSVGGVVLLLSASAMHSDPLSLNAWATTLIGLSMLTARTMAKIAP